eukprot:Em0010g398a
MASILLNLLEPFDFKQPDQWGKWRRRFEQFRVASGLSSEEEVLTERLQLDPELMLEKAMKMVRQREAVKEQQQILKGDINPSETNVDRVWQKTAWEATCNNCQKRGHFSACCRASKICTIGGEAQEESCKDTSFLGTIGGDTWNVDMKVNGLHSLNFKIDTGADVSVISLGWRSVDGTGGSPSVDGTGGGPSDDGTGPGGGPAVDGISGGKHWKQLKDEEIAEKEKQKLVKKKGKQTQNAKGKASSEFSFQSDNDEDYLWLECFYKEPDDN